MECKERQRLTEEYFDALKRQNSVSKRLKALRAAGDQPGVTMGEAQETAAIEETYETWDAVNRHQCTEECERG
jgi:hypothetical protein